MTEFSYIHIPFCASKCRYCAFTSFINLNFIEEYIKALLVEIKTKYKKEQQKTLYFGGGTPSLLKIEHIKQILNQFSFKKNAEITFEINPENASAEYLKALFDIGVNRLSFGVQTFDDKILELIGRRHSAKTAIKAIETAKNQGFKNISADLIYGLPNQNVSKWEKDLETVKNLELGHISTYGLKIEDKTYFSKFPPENVADEETQALMYEILAGKLNQYYHYEISNFAKNKNFISHHNLNYWNMEPYYGFGLSASGFDGTMRYKNSEIIKEYLKNPVYHNEEIKLTEADILEETIFLGFRKLCGIDINKINQKFNINFNKKYEKILTKYQKTGHLIKTKNGYKLSDKGVLISNYILCDFLN